MSLKYHIECNDRQMTVLKNALDFYERVIGLGQLEELEYRWRMHTDLSREDYDQRSLALKHCMYAAKSIGWGFSPNVSMSIRTDSVPEEFRIAYDMTQIIRKAVFDSRAEDVDSNDKEMMKHLKYSVSNSDFWAASSEEPIKVSFSSESTE